MGSDLVKKKIKIIDVMLKGKKYDYLRPKGEIILQRDEDFDVICFDIREEGWCTNTVYLWPRQKNQIKLQFFSDRTPRCSSISTDSGLDEEFLMKKILMCDCNI